MSYLDTFTDSYQSDFKAKLEQFKDFEEKGIGALKIKNYKKDYYKQYRLSINEPFRDKFLINNKRYIIASSNIKKIQGILISENNSKATVRFTYTLEPNDLYPLKVTNGSKVKCNFNEIEDELTFTKFDTGWKIEKQ